MKLAIADDYARYLANRGTIDAIIELDPTSAFAANDNAAIASFKRAA